MLKGLHLLLTYSCTYECDHCFVYSSPKAGGTFTMTQIRKVLCEAGKIGSITTIFLEGGEPFLYYPLMLEAVKAATTMGFDVGIVTNGYFATTEEDAELWLAPLGELGISNLTISDDVFHSGDEMESAAKRAIAAAGRLSIPMGTISVEQPSTGETESSAGEKGEPIVGGGVMFRGRAAAKLVPGLPVRDWTSFNECPHEELEHPGRVHLDCYGNVSLCQGISIGNMWETPLSEMVKEYNARVHAICGILKDGGPARLVREYGLNHDEGYVDACHLCYSARAALLDRFPVYLSPRQVYGL
jgi:hypothetical protein